MRPMTMMMAFALALFSSHATADREAQPLRDLLDPNWATNELWNDGQAEVATYNASRIVYGNPRPHTAHLITVYEDFNTDFYVKADWPYGDKPILPVLKLNYVAEIPTPNYPYRFMVSAFADRADISNLVRMTVSSQEWCGMTFKDFQLWKDRPVQVYHSYWDGQGNGTHALDAREAFFEEELFLVLRALPFEDGLMAEFSLYDNQTTTKAPKPVAVPATLEVQDEGDGWQVTVVTTDGRRIDFVFGKEYPNVLRLYRHNDGRRLTLDRVERDAYWNIRE